MNDNRTEEFIIGIAKLDDQGKSYFLELIQEKLKEREK